MFKVVRISASLVTLLSVIVVHKCVVDVNDPVIQIDVTPSETGYLTDPQAGANHDGENRIPVRIHLAVLQKIQKQFLFRLFGLVEAHAPIPKHAEFFCGHAPTRC